MEKTQCACYKSQKEKNIRCTYRAKPNSIYCGNHQKCSVNFASLLQKGKENVVPPVSHSIDVSLINMR